MICSLPSTLRAADPVCGILACWTVGIRGKKTGRFYRDSKVAKGSRALEFRVSMMEESIIHEMLVPA